VIFKFREKPVEITAFVHEEYYYVAQYNPIRRASEFVPDWYKKMPHTKYSWEPKGYTEVPTGKSCVGIIKTFQHGFILPMWCDLALDIDEDNFRYQFSDTQSSLEVHNNNQLPNFNTNTIFCKLISPWVYKCSQEINLLYTEPTFFLNHKPKYSVPSIINTSINKTIAGNLFLFIEYFKGNIDIQQGTPLLHLVPLIDKPVKINIEVTTKNKWYNIRPGPPKISFLRDGLKKLKFHRNQKD